MSLNYDLITQIASGVAFFIVTFLSFLSKYSSDKKKNDREEVTKKVEKAVNLSNVVKDLALELSEIKIDLEGIKEEKELLKLRNEDLKERLKEVEIIVSQKYPDAINLIKLYREKHPDLSDITTPRSLWDDLCED